MEMPKPGPEHEKLHRFLGSWKGEEKIHPTPWDPAGGTAHGEVVNKLSAGGFAVSQEYRQERDGKPNFEGHGFITWNVPQEICQFLWVDSMGLPPSDFRGNFEGDTLSLTCQGPMGRTRATYDFGTEGQYSFKMDISMDGTQWSPFMEGTYTRAD